MFVANRGNNSVTEVNATTGAYVARLTSTAYGFSAPIAALAYGTVVFVANNAGNSVTEFVASTRSVVRVIRSTHISHPIALAAVTGDLFVLNSGGSVAEFSTSTGAYLGLAWGTTYHFNHPAALAISNGMVFVSNAAGNSVTVLNASTRHFIRLLSATAYHFSRPVGVVAHLGLVWVANATGHSVTVFNATTSSVVKVVTDEYNLPMPGPLAYADGYVFAASPPGSSPMVTQVIASSRSLTWMMCNTNYAFYFNNPQAMAASGTNLWVVNAGGNSLTEMNATTGVLERYVH